MVWANVYAKNCWKTEQAEVEAAVMRLRNNPAIAMVNSEKGITRLRSI
jgi:monomeric isocitrate dehydrogenase